MTLDRAIKSCEEIVEKQKELYNLCYGKNKGCLKIAEEHRQISEWLKELKRLREKETILDKIEDEIEQLPTTLVEIQRPHSVVYRDAVELDLVLRIIDKYK